MATVKEGTKKTNSSARLLTIKDVTEKLNISRYTVYQLTKEGKLPVVKLRDCVRYKPEDVEKLLESE